MFTNALISEVLQRRTLSSCSRAQCLQYVREVWEELVLECPELSQSGAQAETLTATIGNTDTYVIELGGDNRSINQILQVWTVATVGSAVTMIRASTMTALDKWSKPWRSALETTDNQQYIAYINPAGKVSLAFSQPIKNASWFVAIASNEAYAWADSGSQLVPNVLGITTLMREAVAEKYAADIGLQAPGYSARTRMMFDKVISWCRTLTDSEAPQIANVRAKP